VLLVQAFTLTRREHPSGAVGFGAVPHVRDEAHEPGHGTGREKGSVEPVAVRAVPVGVTRCQRPGRRVESLGRCRPIHVVRAPQPAPERLGLEDRADRVDLDRVGGGQHRHDVAGMRRVLDEPLSFEDLQGFADRDPAHAEARGDVVQPDDCTGPQLAILDGAAERVQHALLGRWRALKLRHRHPSWSWIPARPRCLPGDAVF
jgi:hypothetical protein